MQASKIIVSIFDAIINKNTLAKYTGRGNKEKFKGKDRILRLIYDVAHAADNSYTKGSFDFYIVNKVFKYAYKGRYVISTEINIYISLCTIFILIALNTNPSEYAVEPLLRP